MGGDSVRGEPLSAWLPSHGVKGGTALTYFLLWVPIKPLACAMGQSFMDCPLDSRDLLKSEDILWSLRFFGPREIDCRVVSLVSICIACIAYIAVLSMHRINSITESMFV